MVPPSSQISSTNNQENQLGLTSLVDRNQVNQLLIFIIRQLQLKLLAQTSSTYQLHLHPLKSSQIRFSLHQLLHLCQPTTSISMRQLHLHNASPSLTSEVRHNRLQSSQRLTSVAHRSRRQNSQLLTLEAPNLRRLSNLPITSALPRLQRMSSLSLSLYLLRTLS